MKNDIQYIQTVIQNRQMKDKKEKLLNLLAEMLVTVKESTYHYKVEYLDLQGHLLTARHQMMKYKARLLADIEDMHVLISANGAKNAETQCVTITNQLLQTDLYRNNILKNFKKFHPIKKGRFANKEIETALISVKKVGKR
ncbi:hypothetical protein [Sporosarcina sp. P37]|uniref:hypothetical protein n=1 Tax=Sporosarcina sp. P37 TaxID=1930546 RepID=UPI0012F4BB35|nr:hypothetical protein [Sporosarcina sp. P37]